MTDDPLFADYRRRGWSLVPIPAGEKGPRSKDWQTRQWLPSDFLDGCNVGLLLGQKSGEIADVDLDCTEALVLADTYLPPTGAEFGRASKRRSHRLYVAAAAVYETFADPETGETILELRAAGKNGGAHQTVIPPSVHPSGEAITWHGETIAPAVIGAKALRCAGAWLATACLVRRYVSAHASERPGPDLPRLLWEIDTALGRAAYRWLGQPAPDEPRRGWRPKLKRDLTPDEIDLAELVAAMPNNESWEDWNKIGLAIYAACGGSDQGAVAFDDFSAKSPKYDPHETSARWRHYRRSPPDRTGVGKLIKLARAAGWRPKQRAAG